MNDEILDALQVYAMAYEDQTTRDALEMIGLGHETTFPAMPGATKTTTDAKAILLKYRPDAFGGRRD